MKIYILIETRDDETEELGRWYFKEWNDAIAKAKELMDESVPASRKTRDDDINESINELDERGFTNNSRLYDEYRIISAELL